MANRTADGFAGIISAMSNTILRQRLGRRPGVLFGSAELSSDNACGTAVLAALAHERSAHQAP